MANLKLSFDEYIPLRDIVFKTLREAIVTGELKPGERLMEIKLANEMGVSRTPVREAIQMLAEQKLVDVRPGKESRISEVDVVDVPQTYKMLAEIHATAVEFAFDKITDDTLRLLREANDNFKKAYSERDIRGCRFWDNEFHKIIIRLAGNVFLTSFCETLSGHAARIENIYFGKVSGMDELINEHKAIIKAFEERDLEKAKECMRKNWMHTTEVLSKQI